jgi:hypothetical protein
VGQVLSITECLIGLPRAGTDPWRSESGVDGVERGRRGDEELVAPGTREGRVGHRLRYQDLAEQGPGPAHRSSRTPPPRCRSASSSPPRLSCPSAQTVWASATRGKRTSSSRPPTGATSGSSTRYSPRPVRCTSVAPRSRPAAWSPGATLLDAGAEGRVWSLDVSKRYIISRRIMAHPSKSRRQRLPWSESLARRFSARPRKFATFTLWVLLPAVRAV